MASTKWYELKDLKDAKKLASQKVLTLVVHYRSSLEQALDLVRHGETSMPLADHFLAPQLAKQYAPVAKLSDFRYTKKYLSEADVEMLTSSLPNIESLELVILSQAKFSEEQAQLFAKLFAEWGQRMKSLKVWAKVAITGTANESSEDWNTTLDTALFGPINVEFKALEHLTLDVWEFQIDKVRTTEQQSTTTEDDGSQKLFPMEPSDVRNVSLESQWKTLKEFNFGSRNNCTSVWDSVTMFDAIESKNLKAIQVAVPLCRLFNSKDHHITDHERQVEIELLLNCLQAEQDNFLGKRCNMVGVVVSSQTHLDKVLEAFPVLTRLTVELADGATVDESDVVNLIAARMLKLVELRIYYSSPVQLNKPFGSKRTAQLPDVVSLTLGTFSIDLFRYKGQDSHMIAARDKKLDKLDLTLVKSVVPNCRGLVLRIEKPDSECDFCSSSHEHFRRSLRQTQIGLTKDKELDKNFVKGLDAIRLDFLNLSDEEVAGQECIVFTSLMPLKRNNRPVSGSASADKAAVKNEATGESASVYFKSSGKCKIKGKTGKTTEAMTTTKAQRPVKAGAKASPGGNKPRASPVTSPKANSPRDKKATSPQTKKATSPKTKKGSPGPKKKNKKPSPKK